MQKPTGDILNAGSNALPLGNGVASAGTSISYARADHVHPSVAVTLAGDVTGTTGANTLSAIQGRPLSTQTPSAGQALVWSGASWTPATVSGGGGGGGGTGGQIYYLNQATAAGVPVLGLPGTPHKLGRTNESAQTQASLLIAPGSYTLVAGFVTNSGDPDATSIPVGEWDVNIYAYSDANSNAPTVVRSKAYVYNGTTLTLIATSTIETLSNSAIYQLKTMTLEMPETTILSTDRIYVAIEALTQGANHTVFTAWGDGTPAHVHTTFAANPIAGTGLYKLVNGVPQSPATLLVNADVDAAAGIATSKIAGLDIALAGKIPNTAKGSASGVAELDSATKVPVAQLPLATASSVGVVKPGTNLSVTGDGTLNAVSGDKYAALSASSVEIGIGTKTFEVVSGLSYVSGQGVTIGEFVNPLTANMSGIVTSYSGTTMVVNVTGVTGAGTYSSWKISPGGSGSGGNAGTLVSEFTATANQSVFSPILGYSGTDKSSYLVSVGALDQPPSCYSISSANGGTLTLSAGVPVGTLVAVRSFSGGSGGGATDVNNGGTLWYSGLNYSQGDVVTLPGSSLSYYSQVFNNQGHNPATDAGTFWKPINANAFTLQGKNVSSVVPTTGQYLVWNGTAWTPTTVVPPHGSLTITANTTWTAPFTGLFAFELQGADGSAGTDGLAGNNDGTDGADGVDGLAGQSVTVVGVGTANGGAGGAKGWGGGGFVFDGGSQIYIGNAGRGPCGGQPGFLDAGGLGGCGLGENGHEGGTSGGQAGAGYNYGGAGGNGSNVYDFNAGGGGGGGANGSGGGAGGGNPGNPGPPSPGNGGLGQPGGQGQKLTFVVPVQSGETKTITFDGGVNAASCRITW